MRAWWVCSLLFTGCSFTVSGESPGDGASDATDALDAAAEPDVAPGARVTSNLIGLWTFEENGGTTVTDTSGITPPTDLTIVHPASFMWSAGQLTVTAPGDLTTSMGAFQLISRVRASNQLTLEAWVTPANDTQTAATVGQPARVVSLTVRNAGQHLLGLGQDRATWVAQVRTAAPGLDGHGGNPTLINGVVATVAPVHLVVTSTATERRFYVSGIAVSDAEGGLLDAWKDTFVLVMGGDPVQRNTWLGTYHLVAMYDRALPATDVMTNYQAGP